MEEDIELKLINARKMAELKRKAELAAAAKAPKAEKTSKEIVLASLYDRGDEVLQAAYDTFPRETTLIVDQLARLIRQSPREEKISGGELYGLFRNLGLRFSLKTSIKVQERGKFVDLKDKLKMDAEEA